MQSSETVLSVLRERGRRGLPCNELYRQLFNPQLYLLAYGRLYSNHGAMTPGADGETVDGMSLGKIERITDALRHERYRFQPVKRVYIPKKNGKKRQLVQPSWSDKLVGEVIRLLLEAYYEPRFSDRSHGFRARRGCHTALTEVANTWSGTTWFIEGDISDCFGSLDHEIILRILGERIHDNRLLRLIKQMLQAGHLEDWMWNASLCGAPQGGAVPPVLSNIYLDRLDSFVETVLIPEYARGSSRAINPVYERVAYAYARARKRGDRVAVRELRKQQRRLPSGDPRDPGYRRLKTLITHAHTQRARFLGYEITVQHDDTKIANGRRSTNGAIRLHVSTTVIKAKCAPYMKLGKPERRSALVNNDDHTMINTHGAEFRGLAQCYLLTGDVFQLSRVQWVMLTSMLKTLACKYDSSVSKMAARYQTTVETPHGPRRCLQATVECDGRKPLVARFGGVPLKRQKNAILVDRKPVPVTVRRKELIDRLLAGRCEMCEQRAEVKVHHVRKLADLTEPGRPQPAWAGHMAKQRRKTLVVCPPCHERIRARQPTATPTP